MYSNARSPISKLAMIGVVGTIAAGIGFVMQSGSSSHLGAIYADAENLIDIPTDVAIQTERSSLDPSAVASGFKEMPQTLIDSLTIDGIQLTSSNGGAVLAPTGPSVSQSVECAPTVLARPTTAAMIELRVDAPCFGNDRVTILHEGLSITVASDIDGKVSTLVPALSENALIIVSFSGGSSVVAETHVPDLANFDRIVLQWEGESGLQLHAFENGADFNGNGHVWSQQPGTLGSVDQGFLVQLGNPEVASPHLADVYSFPTGYVTQQHRIEFSAEAEVTRFNCLREVEAQTMRFSPITGIEVVDFSLSIPDCQSIGDYLVLNNLFEELKIAQN